jgi:hypothetical protein
MSHLSLFEEDEIFPRMMMPARSPAPLKVLNTSTTSRLTYYEAGPSTRKRTVGEALIRAGEKGSPLWRATKRVPFLKPYAYLLQGLTYGLILVDPLDRLEGGLID